MSDRRDSRGGRPHAAPSPDEPRLALRVAAGVVVVAVLVSGFALLARNIGQGTASLVVGVGWWVGAGAVAILLARRRPGLLAPVAVAIGIATLAGGAYIYPSGANEVDEEIAVAGPAGGGSDRAGASRSGNTRAGDGGDRRRKPARNVEVASGSFEGVSGHSGSGRAEVIELAEGGRVITFSDFEVDPGAGGQDLRVWLSAGSPESDSAATKDYVEIAPLRGESGDQQYDLPKRVDLERYSTVVVWCVPFTTRIAQAELG